MEAADTTNHDRNVAFVTSVGLDATVLRQSTRSIMHVDNTVLSAVNAAISQVTDSVAARQHLLGMRFWTDGDDLTIGQVNAALQAAGLTSSDMRGREMATGGLWAAVGRADGDAAGAIGQVNAALQDVGLTTSDMRGRVMARRR